MKSELPKNYHSNNTIGSPKNDDSRLIRGLQLLSNALFLTRDS